MQGMNFLTKSRKKSTEFSSGLFTVTSTALPWDFYFFKLTQPLMYFFKVTQPLSYFYSSGTVQYTVKEKGGKPGKPYPLPYGWRNPYRNLKSENSQDSAQTPQRNCTFMNFRVHYTACLLYFKGEIFLDFFFFFCTIFNTASSAALRLHCVGGC